MADQSIGADLTDSSKYRVALDLARVIQHHEKTATADRAYWLKLYAECLGAMHLKNPPMKISDEVLKQI